MVKGMMTGKSLLNDYITKEELWACTSCNACVQECPVNIDPLSIIIDLRRFLVMEESKVPTELTGMLTNIENNGVKSLGVLVEMVENMVEINRCN